LETDKLQFRKISKRRTIRKSIYRSIDLSQIKPLKTDEQKNRWISNRRSILQTVTYPQQRSHPPTYSVNQFLCSSVRRFQQVLFANR